MGEFPLNECAALLPVQNLGFSDRQIHSVRGAGELGMFGDEHISDLRIDHCSEAFWAGCPVER